MRERTKEGSFARARAATIGDYRQCKDIAGRIASGLPSGIGPDRTGTPSFREGKPPMTTKTRENRLRRAVARQGFRLTKSRRRDPFALDYGRYAILDEGGFPQHRMGSSMECFDEEGLPYLARSVHALTLDEVEEWVAREATP